MLAGWEIRLSTPPSDSASVKHSSPSRKRCHRGLAALELEAQHGAEARLLALRDLMARMVRKAGIEDLPHRRVIYQALDHLRRIRRMHAHAGMQACVRRADS